MSHSSWVNNQLAVLFPPPATAARLIMLVSKCQQTCRHRHRPDAVAPEARPFGQSVGRKMTCAPQLHFISRILLPVWLYQAQKCVGLSQMFIPLDIQHLSEQFKHSMSNRKHREWLQALQLWPPHRSKGILWSLCYRGLYWCSKLLFLHEKLFCGDMVILVGIIGNRHCCSGPTFLLTHMLFQL